MNSEKGPKHIYTRENQLYYYWNNFRGHLKQGMKDTGCELDTGSRQRDEMYFNLANSFNPLSPGIKLQILLLCFRTFLTELVGRSC